MPIALPTLPDARRFRVRRIMTAKATLLAAARKLDRSAAFTGKAGRPVRILDWYANLLTEEQCRLNLPSEQLRRGWLRVNGQANFF